MNKKQELIDRVRSAIELAEAKTTCLPSGIIQLQGMSGVKGRILLNALNVGLRYLELGSWRGSTFCSAVYKSNGGGTNVSIDNFSEFDQDKTVKLALVANCNTYLADQNYLLIDSAWETVEPASLPNKFDVFMYDANHHSGPTREGILRFAPQMEDSFILVVDDFSWSSVRKGTLEALDA